MSLRSLFRKPRVDHMHKMRDAGLRRSNVSRRKKMLIMNVIAFIEDFFFIF